MDYEQAAKKVRADKPKENFMLVKIQTDYNKSLLLPHKDGVALLCALASAERLCEDYSKPKRVLPLERDTITTQALSNQEYERIKIAALLGITPDEVEEMLANQPTTPT